ncbi:MAG: fumarylacetoacetate hydrolase family protein [Nitrososphaerota archaeon]|nr:fumarylacetoacetate hydrolase family protein [Nitrososphaerota archaeon]MDG6969993.1 fumarylacetoacetate hydrolase family protein [Nitrososphaerota archaeon]MDG6975651.1 fumarylacetoacetate hydrolase family protein [Nitrososphaerota archaeon]
MKLVRFESGGGVRVGVLEGETIHDLSGAGPSFSDWVRAYGAGGSPEGLVASVRRAMSASKKVPFDYKLLRAPFVPSEIWAAGVTYLRSREARETETKMKGLYDYVYSATRPELFLKDSGLRCVGPGDPVCVRGDSTWSVPEPELSVVLDGAFRVVGYTVGNDVSSRDIEGENPLYLPQAKVYRGSSAIGPVVTTADEIPEPRSLKISMRILRESEPVFEGSVNTSQLKREVDELVGYLRRSNLIRTFTVLMTGTSLVPPDSFTLKGGDVVEIEIEKIGILRNPVEQLRA